MGMLINGQWSEQDKTIINGAYVRNTSKCDLPINANDIIEQPGRFILIASWSCPWSHRTMLIRQQLGLSDYLPLHITGGKKVQGYSADSGIVWSVPGSSISILHLHQLYTLSDGNYTGRSTVPILWDSYSQTIISNESTRIIDIFSAITLPGQRQTAAVTLGLVPEQLTQAIDTLNTDIYNQLTNGVYQAGFAQTQAAYNIAVQKVFTMLDKLNRRLATNRYLMGPAITLADWLLFPNLVRFDIDYYLHSRCTLQRLSDLPHLWNYARNIYNLPGIADTVNFDAIHRSNYHDSMILPIMPEQNWHSP
jgi:putative glutathione S-transferase